MNRPQTNTKISTPPNNNSQNSNSNYNCESPEIHSEEQTFEFDGEIDDYLATVDEDYLIASSQNNFS